MHQRYVPAITTLLAGLIATSICLIRKTSIVKSLSIVLIVLIIFYLIGYIARNILVKTLSKRNLTKEKNMDLETLEEETEETEEEIR